MSSFHAHLPINVLRSSFLPFKNSFSRRRAVLTFQASHRRVKEMPKQTQILNHSHPSARCLHADKKIKLHKFKSRFFFHVQGKPAGLGMSVEVVDGSTIRGFVEDEGAFNRSVADRFASLDEDRDGLLSFAELEGELMSLRVLETPHLGLDEDGAAAPSAAELGRLYRGLFAQFDRDGSGAVDLEEFRAGMKEVMLAVANGIGSLPVQMVVEEGSFLKRAVEREVAQEVNGVRE